MKFLSKLLGRPTPPGPIDTDVADRIQRTLTAAGLHRQAHGNVRETIDRALSDAGLMPPAGAGRAEISPAGAAAAGPAAAGSGEFLRGTYANAHGRRDYRLYLPVGYRVDGPPRPLVVMLHGCTQTPEDFATGTRMNALADAHGFLVAYPQQVPKENQARCWNWFRPEDQRAGAGEPSILAGIIRQVAHEHRVDTARIFVAGLSAGAAMAVVLGQTYPDLVRAIGVHSGLPYASAHNVPSAMAAMQGRGDGSRSVATPLPVPMIVFHGDADRTVVPRNADALVRDATGTALPSTREERRVAGGHAFTCERFVTPEGDPRVERWTVHGAGHAWSGGDPAGSYTDPAGPDASAEMIRFFLGLGPPAA